MTLTSRVRWSSRPSRRSVSTMPWESTPSVSSRHPCSSRCSAGSRTLACSMAETTSWAGSPPPPRGIPSRARLLASVPPLVKIRRSPSCRPRSAPEQLGDPLPGVFQQPPGLLPGLVLAGRVGMAGRLAAGHGLDSLPPASAWWHYDRDRLSASRHYQAPPSERQLPASSAVPPRRANPAPSNRPPGTGTRGDCWCWPAGWD